MPTPTPSSLGTVFDELLEANGDDEWKTWLKRVLLAKSDLGAFVAARRGGGPVTDYLGFLKGSFNFSLGFRFDDDGSAAIIRFPKPGHTTTSLRDEKVINEVRVMQFLTQNTTMPIPRVHGWGLTWQSPHGLGPYIIMDYVEGTLLSSVLKRQTKTAQDDVVLDPDVDKSVLDTVYRQIASFLLQLSRLPFNHIGAISETNGNWAVTHRPLTYNMNELASVAGYPHDQFPTSPFDSASDYFDSLSHEHLTHLQTQRNLADNPSMVRARLTARQHVAKLLSRSCIHDSGPFFLYCDDLRPANILIDPSTLQIKAIIDLEYTNAMPSQFTYDPPWWLLLSSPDLWLEHDDLDTFRTQYEPRMEHFLRALQAEERILLPTPPTDADLLSSRMRESWTSGRFWLDYAARKSFDIDVVYWAVLAHETDTPSGSDAETDADRLINLKMEQLRIYKEECSARFLSKSCASDKR